MRLATLAAIGGLLAGCASTTPTSPAHGATPPAPITPTKPPGGGPSADLVNVLGCGADATGATDSTAAIQTCADQAFGATGARHGPNAQDNDPLYFPPGHYKISAPIVLQFVQGGMIYGAGRFASTIENTAGTGVFKTDGFAFSTVRDLQLIDDGKTAPVFDLDWPSNSTVSCQSNTFQSLYIQGGAVGVRIGAAGFMCSENLFLNDFVSGSVHGYEVDNYNALQNTLIGGDVQSATIGVLVNSGSMSIYNTGFQLSSAWDYQQVNAASDASVLSGIRTESPNFASVASGGATITITGISQTNPTAGTFLQINGDGASISGVNSVNGQIVLNKGNGSITASRFGRPDWLNRLYASTLGSDFIISEVVSAYSTTPVLTASAVK